MQVVKRNGDIIEFDLRRIESAIVKAFLSVGTVQNIEIIENLLPTIEVKIKSLEEENINVESIQDIVEDVLLDAGHREVAKNYIRYREEKKLEREQGVEYRLRKKNLYIYDNTNQSVILFDSNVIKERLVELSKNLDNVDVDLIVSGVRKKVYDRMPVSELKLVIINAVKDKIQEHYNYSKLAARIAKDYLISGIPNIENRDNVYQEGFSSYIDRGIKLDMLDTRLKDFDLEFLANSLKPERDDLFFYLGIQTLIDRYFLRDRDKDKTVFELPQWFWMRVAMGLAINEDDKNKWAVKFYDVLSKMDFVSSTPTLFNSGTNHSQMSSCYLNTIQDTLSDIFKVIGSDNSQLSKWAGGIGTDFTNIRSTNSKIKSTNGESQGIIPFVKIFNDVALAVNQGGKRKGAMCAYLEVWHRDFEQFIELRKNTGDERRRAHDINTAAWIPDLFMKRVKNSGTWCLFSPSDVPDLHDLYGKAFEKKYTEYEASDVPKKVVQAKDLWKKMLTSLYETGHPWITFKDPCNVRSPQDHVGVVHSSNLCFPEDTIVAVADGRNGVSIKELAKESNGHLKFPVYSASLRDKTIIGKPNGGNTYTTSWKTEIKQAVAFKTGTKKIVEVQMSNGDTFRCTPDHELATVDGGFIQAKDSIGHILQPFFSYTPKVGTPYRHINTMTNANYKQHKMIFNHHFPGIDYCGKELDHIDEIHPRFDSIANLRLIPKSQHKIKSSNSKIGKSNPIHRLSNKELYTHNKKFQTTGSTNPSSCGLDNFQLIELCQKVYDELGIFTRKEYFELRNSLLPSLKLPCTFSKYRFGGDWSLFFSYVTREKDYNGEFEPTLEFKDYDVDSARKFYINDNFYKHKDGDVYQLGLEVVSIIEAGIEDVYDLTVEDNHNFFIITSTEDEEYLNSQGVLVHNCTEITLNTSKNETAVCNLGSLNLSNMLSDSTSKGFEDSDFLDREKVEKTLEIAIRMLDNVIDNNFYPIPEAKKANLRHRAIGLGVMGYQDCLLKLGIPFDSLENIKFADKSMEMVSYYAIKASSLLAKERGSYESYDGSKWSKGILPIDSLELLEEERGEQLKNLDKSSTLDWDFIRNLIKENGMRNSNVMAIAPTATISNISGVYPCIEPIFKNIYMKENLSGNFLVLNKYLVDDLKSRGLWSTSILNKIKLRDGSIQTIDEIPDEVKSLHKEVYEISPNWVVDTAAARLKWIDQAVSTNIFLKTTSGKVLNDLYFRAWEAGLKTTYYLRTLGASQVTKTVKEEVAIVESDLDVQACSILNAGECEACQ